MENKYSGSTLSSGSASSKSNHSGVLTDLLDTYRRYGKFIKYLQLAAILLLIILVFSIYKSIVNGNATISENEKIKGIAINTEKIALLVEDNNNGYRFLISSDTGLSYTMLDTLIEDEKDATDFLNGYRSTPLTEPADLFDISLNQKQDEAAVEQAAEMR